MLQDLRYALRAFGRKPLVAAVAVVTLGLGIGAATTVFTVVEAVLLRPLPFHDPGRLVRIWELTPGGDRFSVATPNYLELRAQSRTLEQVAAFGELGTAAVLSGDGDPRRITAVPVSASLADVLGVRPQTGRMFTPDEDRPGLAERYIVLSDTLWRSRFGADPAVAGRQVRLDGEAYVVTGVMPPGFDFPGAADAWIPLAADPLADRTGKSLAVIGRLAPGRTHGQLDGELRSIARRWSESRAESNAGWSAGAVPFSEWMVAPRFREAVWVLLGAVGLLLLLACANVANLLIAQAAARRGEMRIRAALGAARARLVRQLLTESTLLAVAGTVTGILIAAWSIDAVRGLGAGRIPRLEELAVNAAVLAFACLAGGVSCVVFGLAPALHAARVDLRAGASEGFQHTAGSRRFRHGLVVVEVALALLLLVSAGLMARSFVQLVNVEVGFEPRGAIAMSVDLPETRYPGDRVAGFYGELLDRVRGLPGVSSAGATSTNPFRQSGFSNNVTPEERAAQAPPSGLVQAGWRSVTPGFFEAMGIPLLRGRTFDAADAGEAGRVAVMTEGLARRLWPNEPAVGKRFYWGGTTGRTWTVIGVSGDIRDVEIDAEPAPLLFVPHARITLPSMTIVARTSSGMAGSEAALRDVLREMDAALPAPATFEIAASRADSVAGPRFNLLLLGAFALVALVLAITGVYAMLAFTVAEQRREIAVRMALGASGSRVGRLILRRGVTLGLLGVAAGSAAGFGVTRIFASLLYGVAPTDPLTFGLASAVLLLVVAIACYLPARHASQLDPMAILRE